MQFTDVFDQSDIMKIESVRIYRQQAESMTTCLVKKKCWITKEIYLVICLSNPVFKKCHELISSPECMGSTFIVVFLSSTSGWNWKHNGNTSYRTYSAWSHDDLKNMQPHTCTQPLLWTTASHPDIEIQWSLMFEIKHPKELPLYPLLWMGFQIKEAIRESDILDIKRSEKNHHPLNIFGDVAWNSFYVNTKLSD